MEEKSINKLDMMKKIHAELADIYYRKNQDYGDSFGESFEQLGLISAVTRILDKTNRLVNLSSGKDQHVNDESIEDTLMDLANYSVMTLIELRKHHNLDK